MDNQSIVLAALRYLASRCDGAQAQDGQGFNKPDSWRGKQLAAREYLQPEEVVEAFTILRKYAPGQLASGGITLPDEQTAKADAIEGMETRGKAALNPHGTISVMFPYCVAFVQRIKTIPGARFVNNQNMADNGSKYWTVPLSSGKDLLAKFPKFDIPETTRLAIANYKPAEGPTFVGKVTLDNDALVIAFDYSAPLVARVKAIPGAKFNGTNKTWRVPLAQFKPTEFKDFDVAPDVARRVLEIADKQSIAKEKTKELLTYVDAPLPSGRQLFEHQKTGVKFLLEHRRAILADDMGLGKTTQALVAASLYKLPVIVVCPASLVINWRREADMVGVTINVYSWAKMPDEPANDFILICDEAHYAQSLKSTRTKSMLKLAKSEHCQSLILLTGTPIKNGRPANLYPLLQACKHPIALNKSAYEKRYCNAHATPWTQWDITGASNLDELHEKTRDVMLRRTKKECLDLPEKTRVIRPVDASKKAEELYSARLAELKAEYQKRLAEGKVSSEAEALVLIGQLRQAASMAKVSAAVEIAEEITEQGGQIVIFTAFQKTATAIAVELGVAQVIGENQTPDVFSGDTPLAMRQAMVDDFQSGKSKVFICTIGAGGVGITLTAAQTVILVDRPWTPGESSQAEDRLHRIGQTSAVTAIWLQYGDCDEYIDAIIQQKQERIDLVLAGKRKTMRGTGTPGQLATALAESLLGGHA